MSGAHVARVGFLDGLTSLWRRPVSLVASAPPTIAASAERGVSGTANYGGRLQVEPNSALRDTSGYGSPGSTQWGEWEEARRANAYVASAIDFVMGPIRDARVDFEQPPEGVVADDVAKAQIDFLRWNFTDGLEAGLPSILAQVGGGMLASGFAIVEPVGCGVSRPELPGGKGFALKRLAERLPNSLSPNPWVETPDGSDLLAIRQHGLRGTRWETVELKRDDVLLFTWQRSGNNWAGFSAFRSVWYIANRIMPMLLKLLGVTLQREGAGVPVAESVDLDAELTPEQRDQLREVFAGLTFHEAAGVIMPSGWKLNWVFSPGANKGHVLAAWQQLGVVVLQQVGAQQLALGTAETGSRSVGEVHDARAMAYVRGVTAVMEAELNRLVRKLVDINWGPQLAYPKLKLTLRRPEMGVVERVNAMKAAKDGGLLTVLSRDENNVRESLGLAPIDDDEREAAKAARAVVAPVDEVTRPAGGAGEEGANSPAPNPRLSASVQRGGWAPWRPLRASEQRMALASMSTYLDDSREAFERRVKPEVLGMLAMAAPSIEAAMADGSPDEVADLPLNAKRLDKVIRQYLAEVRVKGAEYARAELQRTTRLTAAAEDEQDDKNPADEATDDADEVVEAQAKALSRRMQNRLRSELEREAIDVIRTGGDASEVVARTVSRQLESGAFKADAGSVTAKVMNVGRDEAARLVGGVTSVRYSAILDAGTCGPCTAADGKTAVFGSEEHDALLPPNRDCAGGDNCRCLLEFLVGGDE